MQLWKRFALALTIVLSGFLLVPFIALPHESFRWQLYSEAYGVEPAMGTNFANGGPGSFFLISGFGFPAGATLTLKANGIAFGAVTANAQGEFQISISTAGAGVGRYVIAAEGLTAGGQARVLASTSFNLVASALQRAQVQGPLVLTVPNTPAGLGNLRVYLPLVAR